MTAKARGFEWTTRFNAELTHLQELKASGEISNQGENLLAQKESFQLPHRSTKDSAGYDFSASEYVTVPSIWKQATKYMLNTLFSGGKEVDEKLFKPTLVPTDVKAYMQEGEYLELANRSSNPLKRFLILANGVGVIDRDYHNNPDNDGHIMFQFLNFGIKDVTIKPGEKIGQGIFKQFLLADNDTANGARNGGFGSTGK